MPPSSWDESFEQLIKFRDRNNGSVHPRSTEDWSQYGGRNLYKWLAAQRFAYRNRERNKTPILSKEREEKLRAIGIDLDSPPSSASTTSTATTTTTSNIASTSSGGPNRSRSSSPLTSVPERAVSNNADKGEQSTAKTASASATTTTTDTSTTTKKRKKMSNRSKGKRRNSVVASWDEYFRALVEYREKNGGSVNIPSATIDWDKETGGLDLYEWTRQQKQRYRNKLYDRPSAMTKDQMEKLLSIGFHFEEGSKATFDDYVDALIQYRDNNDGCLVIDKDTDWDDYGGLDLYRWIMNKTTLYRAGEEGREPCLPKLHIDKIQGTGYDLDYSPAQQRTTWPIDCNDTDSEDDEDNNDDEEEIEDKEEEDGDDEEENDEYRIPVRSELRAKNGSSHRPNVSKESSNNVDDSQPHAVEGEEARAQRASSSSSSSSSSSDSSLEIDQVEPQLIDDEEMETFDDEERSLIAREEEWLTKTLDDEITAAEERSMMKSLDREIAAAEEYEKKSRIEYVLGDDGWDHDDDEEDEYAGWNTINKSICPPKPRHKRSGVVKGSVEGLERCRAVKKIPKFLRSTKRRFLEDKELKKDLVLPFKEKLPLKYARTFYVELRPTENDDNSLDLIALGPPLAVGLFIENVKLFLESKQNIYNYDRLVAKGKRIVVDVDPNKRLGARVLETRRSDDGAHGLLLFVDTKNCKSQLAKKLGISALTKGAAMVKAGPATCKSLSDFTDQHQRYKKKRRSLKLEILVHKDADLSQVPRGLIRKKAVSTPNESDLHTSASRKDATAAAQNRQVTSRKSTTSTARENQLGAAGKKKDREQEQILKAQLHSYTHTSSHAGQGAKSSGSANAIPRKRKPENQSIVREKATTTESSASIVDKTTIPGHIPKKAKNTTLQADHAEGGSQQFATYKMEFQTNKPLGFYCETVKGNTGEAMCKIMSVCPHEGGQARGDQRIQAGTVVKGVTLGSNVHDIHGTLKLKEFYRTAKEKKISIILSFINTYVSEESKALSTKLSQEWTGCEWRGKSYPGWGGGEDIDNESAKQTLEDNKTINSSASGPNVSSHNGSQQQASLSEEWVERFTEISKPSLVELKPILKSSASEPKRAPDSEPMPLFQENSRSLSLSRFSKTNPKRGVRLTFSANNEFRMYDKESETNRFLVRSSDKVASQALLEKSASAILRESLEKDTIQDTLRLLNDGIASDIEQEELQKLRDMVKPEQSKEESEKRDTSVIQDRRIKYTLLKVYINASFALNFSRALRKWCTLATSVVGVENLQVNAGIGNANNFHLHLQVFHQRLDKTQRLMSPPSQKLETHILYPRDSPPLRLRYNPMLPDEKEQVLIIRLWAKSIKNETYKELGCAEIKLSALYTHCKGNNRHWEGCIPVRKEGELLVGDAKVKVHVKLDHHGNLEDKKIKAVAKIKEVITWIVPFNDELRNLCKEKGTRNKVSLNADIRVWRGSLLHAAIYVVDVKRVKELLSFGADPLVNCYSVGSALRLAMDMLEGIGMKSSGGNPSDGKSSEDDPAVKEEKTNLEQIIQLLEEASKNSTDTQSAPAKLPVIEPTKASVIEFDDLYWTIQQDKKRFICKYQVNGYCKKSGPDTCSHIHYMKPLGDELQKKWEQTPNKHPVDPKSLRGMTKITSTKDSVGRIWYTAGVTAKRNDDRGIRIILAEGGENSRREKNGLTWYPSEDEALKGLEKPLTVFRHLWN